MEAVQQEAAVTTVEAVRAVGLAVATTAVVATAAVATEVATAEVMAAVARAVVKVVVATAPHTPLHKCRRSTPTSRLCRGQPPCCSETESWLRSCSPC